MGRCVYCQQPAGMFRESHEACEQRHRDALQDITQMVRDTMVSRDVGLAQTLTQRVRERGLDGYAEEPEMASAVRSEVNATYYEWIQQIPLDVGLYAAMCEVMRSPFFMETAPARGTAVRLPAAPPTSEFFMFEQLLYAERGRSHPVAAVAGSTMRLLAGDQILFADPGTLYGEWRVQVAVSATTVGFGGEYTSFAQTHFQTAETSGIAFLDRGTLLLGRLALYFSGLSQVHRISYTDVMRSRPYADGFSIHRGSDVGAEQFFKPAYPAPVNRVLWMRFNEASVPDDLGDYPPLWQGQELA